MATVVLLGTCDSKLEELLYLRDQILQAGEVDVTLIDLGRHPADHEAITISQPALLSRYYNNDCGPVSELPRGELVKLMSSLATEAVRDLHSSSSIHGIVAAGGSGGTAVAAPAMRNALPLGFPKLLVSTVTSGDVSPYVAESDITMMHSVVDIAGTNPLLRQVLANAGAMIAGAAKAYAARQMRDHVSEYLPHTEEGASSDQPPKKRVGITMFGVTTPAVELIRRHLTRSYPVEVFVFHATGTGGRAMEKMVREGQLDAVLDLTTTEFADYEAGGVMSAGEDRLRAAVGRGIPLLVSLGALDMVNFGPADTVPQRYLAAGRRLYEHNSAVTLMRVSEDEARKIGRHIASNLLLSEDQNAKSVPGKAKVVIPKGGLSLLSTPGQPFEDRAADEALFGALRDGLRGSSVEIIEDERHINDEGFAEFMAEELVRMMGLKGAENV
ncbi:hypothetical protein QBC42DRAFT_333569 [Cladorrhinum samala]|uniref:Uncharacterized protein n=1 Tax=Cladorrhinum samala TaxID=585594 RepID=A0AAV9HIB1_9PEZI|nr:hypothetical protein QBC42DRAFT_333569 [Cladorrhinum samala]